MAAGGREEVRNDTSASDVATSALDARAAFDLRCLFGGAGAGTGVGSSSSSELSTSIGSSGSGCLRFFGAAAPPRRPLAAAGCFLLAFAALGARTICEQCWVGRFPGPREPSGPGPPFPNVARLLSLLAVHFFPLRVELMSSSALRCRV